MVRVCTGLLWVLPVLCGCGGEIDRSSEADTLILEVGNENPRSEAWGGEQKPPPEVKPEQPEVPVPGGPGAGTPAPDPAPAPEPTPAPRTVVLKDGETLYQVAATHLGTGNRYPEILALNGWTEEQARRLKAGTTIKLPVR